MTSSQSRTGRHFVAALFLLAALVAGMGLRAIRLSPALQSRTFLPAKAMVEIDPSTLDFGEAPVGGKMPWVIRLLNRSAEPVTIVKVESTCSCTVVLSAPFELGPGESRDVALELDLTVPSKWKGGRQYEFSVDLMPVVRLTVDGEQRLLSGGKYALHGSLNVLFRADPPVLELRDALVNGLPFPSNYVRLHCLEPMAEVRAECRSDFATVTISKVDGTDKEFLLELTPQDYLPLGGFQELVQLKFRRVGDEHFEPGALPVAGKVVSDVYAAPDMFAFGAVERGRRTHEKVFLYSRSGTAFTMQSLRSSGNRVDIARTSKTGFQFTVSTEAPGDQLEMVTVVVSSDLDKEIALEIPIKWYTRDIR